MQESKKGIGRCKNGVGIMRKAWSSKKNMEEVCGGDGLLTHVSITRKNKAWGDLIDANFGV